MRTGNTDQPKRHNVTMPDSLETGMHEIRAITGMQSNAEVIRRAITFLERTLELLDEGYTCPTYSEVDYDPKKENLIRFNITLTDTFWNRATAISDKEKLNSVSASITKAVRLLKKTIGNLDGDNGLTFYHPSGNRARELILC